MSKFLIASCDMEVGGVERSLAGMLNAFDYDRHQVDLMLYRHRGDFMELLPRKANLLEEMPQYATFRASIADTAKSGQVGIALSRLLSKAHAGMEGKLRGAAESGYIQQQLMWLYALPLLPKLERRYDAAISYLWPHYFVADKVQAAVKIAWIHTDYSTIPTKRSMDVRMWRRFDHIVAVSDSCKDAFLEKYGELRGKVTVIENMISPRMVRSLAAAEIPGNPMAADKRFKLLTVARLSSQKGLDLAIEALRILTDRGYGDIVWYVAGYGGEEEALKRQAERSGLRDRFVWLGKQTNPYPYMKACDLYVQPSRYEGKAVTVTEAKMIGKPVLITNYSTAASQVEDGKDGCIAELSAEGIANGIEALYRDAALRERLAARCAASDYGNEGEIRKLYELMARDGRRSG